MENILHGIILSASIYLFLEKFLVITWKRATACPAAETGDQLVISVAQYHMSLALVAKETSRRGILLLYQLGTLTCILQ